MGSFPAFGSVIDTNAATLRHADACLRSGLHGQVTITGIATAMTELKTDSQRDDAERTVRRDKDEREDEPRRAPPQPRQPSMIPNLLVTAVVALTCGVIGAMGYTHFVGPNRGGASSSRLTAGAARSHKSSTPNGKAGDGTSTDAAGTSSNQASTSSAVQESSSASDAAELRQQMRNLSHRIDQLSERLERLQTMLSLAVPLLQRLAPKN
jgi:hypothetical protein